MMNRSAQALFLFFILAFSGAAASAQVTFVHITDPHVFDDKWVDERKKASDPTNTEDNRLDNQAALASALWDINERIKKGAKYDFGVITGDLGIEFLVEDSDKSAKEVIDARIEKAAAGLASWLTLSGVPKWLFVPGNNDVLCETPENIHYYHQFMTALIAAAGQYKITVVDLCPAETPTSSKSAIEYVKGFAFIGFNNSSFKNAEPDKVCHQDKRISLNAQKQKTYVLQVADLLKNDDAKYAYIFYHIPEIDDPYLVTLKSDQEPLLTRRANQDLIGGSFFESAWYVTKDVRDEWNKVVMNPKVKGLFAGHFHDNKRSSYLGFQWLRTQNYPPETLSKLHVCPPLALRIQYDKSERARGFQEVYIDDKGEVSTRLVWLNQGSWGLANDVEAKESESLRQLGLGDLYAGNGQLKEAEAAYIKAAESNWPPTRQRALTSAANVVAQQNSYSEKYFRAPLRAALATATTTAGLVIITFIALAVLILVATPFVRDIGRWRGRNKIRIIATSGNDDLMGAGFEQIIVTIHGRMSSHYSRRHSLIIGRAPLPMLFSSQTGELADLAESVAPGAVGKVIGWLIKRTDSPQYTIVGTIQSSYTHLRGPYIRGFSGAIFVALSERGSTLRTWHETKLDADFADEEIQLAFKSLKHLARHQNP